ncbi:hypothetical protein M9458_052366 [Cirrhinus mrigala]|uniref:Uncharacterized protein n=1 Tax=Cirrhinus mrigala TaxID=683832 RepID=A0ABD0MX37_CIRMR
MNYLNPSGQLARWSLRLQDFDFSIVHKPGVQNNVPDTLSRSPLPHSAGPIDILPMQVVWICTVSSRSRSLTESNSKQLQEDDPVVRNLIQNLEEDGMDEEYVVQDSLLYYKGPKVTCGLQVVRPKYCSNTTSTILQLPFRWPG